MGRLGQMVLSTICIPLGLLPASAAEVPPGTQLADRQEIVRHIKDEPASLDPAKSAGLPEIQVIRDLFEGLTNEDANGKIIPGVAERWQTSDNKIWIFTLRENLCWSDGTPLTADDFVYSWRRLVDPATASPFASFAALAGIENAADIAAHKLPLDKLGVSALDDRHLKVTLNRPLPWFPAMVANFSLYPVPRHVIDASGNNWTRPGTLVGNGAYKLQARIVNEKIVLERNHRYWDDAKSVLTKVTFVPVNDEASATKRYRAGDIDITESFPKNMYGLLKKSLPGQVYTPDQLGTYYYAFNTRQGPTSDVRVRRALSWSIDRKIIAHKVLGTGEKPAWHFTPDVTAGYTPKTDFIQQHPQAELNAQAKALLAAAGYGPQKPLNLTLLYNISENNQKIAIAVASMWKKTLGVNVRLQNQEWKTYLDSRNSGKFDVIRASWVGDYNEPSTFLSLLTSDHSGNFARFSNSQYDAVLARAAAATNARQRNAEYQRAEQIIADEAPIAPIYQYTNGRLIKPWVKGYPISNAGDVAYSRQLFILRH
ncbi:oligopeptide ABC transporter substrate-binding protein OppA [Erwinia sp. OLTSP20]|uniref:peptide ABC transporter substrate-binding protein n=1 Tax=unclassified Erwinia TaxID=2622719 RepID=UPI000C19C880|nr:MULTISPECIES: peptide ABC transporter substrate-binding protein [unclassified Erwinia]PIJ51765.1 oligopeptide ABC transporter substrate-binding protein OppA [Erwinia sp. OAMSP11]PIJ74354.1 oligopeptide ABC transporter substrate-binding protein OppA [Erwinia sp. OLSSP12]PIJ83813.1 oligopeptide ABC transporter substrate-binding protein OppA [Erwinia sp. OLCASP19]PIJ86856.1 oligopeptide ABC transporter substrate-binding protein OppA [Erwinia sp. OLMTSP26]PIJ88263.1 oligopeptide ABC transporter